MKRRSTTNHTNHTNLRFDILQIFRFKYLFLVIILFLFSCATTDNQPGQPIPPPKSTRSIRLEDIAKQIAENPVAAINYIYIYKETYASAQNEENEEWMQLLQYEKQAADSLISFQEKAIKEERWEDAASFGRSLASIGVTVKNARLESDLLLADAKKKLADNNVIGAFISAVKSAEMKPLDSASAFLFLEKAVNVKQRRAAAFFLAAAEAAGGRNISANMREYARGRDTVSDMVKGVATVLVDRGIRIERGMGIPDRVMGSAFFVDAAGYLITNYHVIESEVDPKYKGYSRLYIRMGDSTSPRTPARVVGWDKALDLALIKTEVEAEFVFSLVDRVIPKVGDTVLAIGSPLGLEKTVTQGIVSAVGRRFLQIGDVFQIDAAVEHGNSGGPVVDNEGRLVGIAFAGVQYHQGLNFAIPAERLAAALPAMIKGGKAQRPWLGIALSETYSGAEIIYTSPNAPAALHRIGEGTMIKTVNGKTITASQGALIPALQNEIFLSGPGELVALETVNAEGTVKKNIVMTAARPDLPLFEAAKVDKRERIAAPLYGMILTPLHNSIFSTSYLVKKVVRGSIADEAGISEDDPVSINRFRVLEDDGYAIMDISIKKRRMGYLETNMQLPAWLDSPDTF